MAGISRYEKIVMAATVAFLLVTGSWFLSRQSAAAPYTVVTEQRAADDAAGLLPEDAGREGIPQTLMEGEVINVNTADVYDLQRLPGIGEKRALAIIAYRQEHGPFIELADLMQVSGIGEGILSGLADYAAIE